MSFDDTDEPIQENEWSHFIESEKIGLKPMTIALELEHNNLPQLCKRLGLHSINDLRADLTLVRNQINKVIHIEGRIQATIEQECVVTMEPVSEQVSDEFEAWFAEPSQAVSFTKAKRERMSLKEQDEQPIIEEFDDPEAVIDGKIDLGELVTQHLSLALNPYPRAESAEFGEKNVGLEDAPDGTYDNPFAALKDWKMQEKKKDS